MADHPTPWDDDLTIEEETASPAPERLVVGNKGRLQLGDFWAFMPGHSYIFTPTRALWPAASVNARIGPVALTDAKGAPLLDESGKKRSSTAAAWLDRHKPVEQMTWAPGQPMIIRDRVIHEGGWLERAGVTTFNLYLPPTIIPGDSTKAEKWVRHIRYVYPDDADHIIDWLAHRVQRPHEKVNHALVLAGEQGIGKDTLLEPVRHTVGPWNFQEVSPVQILGRFNSFLKSVILRISEARDLGEFDRFQFYDHTKTLTAAPPDVLRVDEKHMREYPIVNCCGVSITSNHRTDGIFLPPDDRRHFVCWSERTKDDFNADYWRDLYAYYQASGYRHVAAFLAQRDLSGFDPKAPPPKTTAFWAIVDANRPPEEPELADLLDQLGRPQAITLGHLQNMAAGDLAEWLKDRRNRRTIPHRLQKCGYVAVRNPDAEDGLWKVFGKRHVIYATASLSPANQIAAARRLL
jgi:hypothetical protein